MAAPPSTPRSKQKKHGSPSSGMSSHKERSNQSAKFFPQPFFSGSGRKRSAKSSAGSKLSPQGTPGGSPSERSRKHKKRKRGSEREKASELSRVSPDIPDECAEAVAESAPKDLSQSASSTVLNPFSSGSPLRTPESKKPKSADLSAMQRRAFDLRTEEKALVKQREEDDILEAARQKDLQERKDQRIKKAEAEKAKKALETSKVTPTKRSGNFMKLSSSTSIGEQSRVTPSASSAPPPAPLPGGRESRVGAQLAPLSGPASVQQSVSAKSSPVAMSPQAPVETESSAPELSKEELETYMKVLKRFNGKLPSSVLPNAPVPTVESVSDSPEPSTQVLPSTVAAEKLSEVSKPDLPSVSSAHPPPVSIPKSLWLHIKARHEAQTDAFVKKEQEKKKLEATQASASKQPSPDQSGSLDDSDFKETDPPSGALSDFNGESSQNLSGSEASSSVPPPKRRRKSFLEEPKPKRQALEVKVKTKEPWVPYAGDIRDIPCMNCCQSWVSGKGSSPFCRDSNSAVTDNRNERCWLCAKDGHGCVDLHPELVPLARELQRGFRLSFEKHSHMRQTPINKDVAQRYKAKVKSLMNKRKIFWSAKDKRVITDPEQLKPNNALEVASDDDGKVLDNASEDDFSEGNAPKEYLAKHNAAYTQLLTDLGRELTVDEKSALCALFAYEYGLLLKDQ
ncbi:unnamed protein product [Alternaria alternata]